MAPNSWTTLAIGRVKVPRIVALDSAYRMELLDDIVGIKIAGQIADAGDWEDGLYPVETQVSNGTTSPWQADTERLRREPERPLP